MKVAWWLGIGTVLMVVLLFAIKSGERRGTLTEQSTEMRPATTPYNNAIVPGRGTTDNVSESGNAATVTSVPNQAPVAVSTGTSETPPRTTLGTPLVEISMELPLVDPATIPVDKNRGRIEVTGAVRDADVVRGGAPHPLAPKSDQPVETNDGPLGGLIPRPDPSVPGPAIQGLSTAEPGEVRNPAAMDPFGPGQPIDPEAAAVATPNFVLPGPDSPDESPDMSPDANKAENGN